MRRKEGFGLLVREGQGRYVAGSGTDRRMGTWVTLIPESQGPLRLAGCVGYNGPHHYHQGNQPPLKSSPILNPKQPSLAD